ncbi:MAG: hypothetical protein IKJ47_00120 [Oscillospiraceae bacterium]|nr:hypothetical protein [Oscillospiraceae bacterium]
MTTTRTTYSPTFEKYLDETFTPAQDWALSDEGAAWIKENIPTLEPLIEKYYDSCLFAIYCIKLNSKPLYIGESIRTVRRLCVHAYNICHFPELFGLKEEDIEKNTITMELLEKDICGESTRKNTELYYISKLKPIIQKGGTTDSCIPRKKRAEKVLPYLNKVV